MVTMSEILLEIKNLQEEIKRSNLFKKPFYTTREASEYLGVSVSYMQKLVASKQISHSRPTGKLIFIRRNELEAFITRNRIHSNDEVDDIVANNLLNLKTKIL
jgi:excisionase family DNA binding protein